MSAAFSGVSERVASGSAACSRRGASHPQALSFTRPCSKAQGRRRRDLCLSPSGRPANVETRGAFKRCASAVATNEEEASTAGFEPGPDFSQPLPGFDSIEDALADMRAGKFLVVLDDEDRENEGDLIIAAETISEEQMAFLVRHSSGLVCVGMAADDLSRLDLPLMVSDKRNEEAMYTAFTVSVDLKHGTSTGISAADRAATLRALADPAARPEDFNRPGHIFPLKARPLGVLERPGHTEAAVDLARLAGCRPCGVLCEVVDHDSGAMMRTAQLQRFAKEHGLRCITIRDLIRYRLKHDSLVERLASAQLPTKYGTFQVHTFRSRVDGQDHIALTMGDVEGARDVLVRVHSENILGDVFASARDDGCDQLAAAMERIATEGRGVLVYLRGHEGRGIGLAKHVEALVLQQEGQEDAVSANARLGLPADARSYTSAALIVKDLGVASMRVLTNNPDKYRGLSGVGVDIAGREPILTCATAVSEAYLAAVRDKLGHQV